MPVTRSAKRARVKNVRDQALEIVLNSGYLPWYEAVKVGQTCKEMQNVWQETKSHLCEPLLEALHQLKLGTNVCRACEKVAFPASERQCECAAHHQSTPLAHLDPRSDPNYYSEFSTWDKCKALAEFTAGLVSSFRRQSNLDNLTNSDVGRIVSRFDWHSAECRFLAERKPRRFAFMINALASMCCQTNFYGGEAIFELGLVFSGAVEGLDRTVYLDRLEGAISRLFPLEDSDINDNILRVHNWHGQIWETLGPVLTRKLNFLAPFVSTEENGTCSTILPTNMEPVDPHADALVALALFE